MRRPVVLVAMMCFAEILGMLAFATYPTLIPTFQSEWRLTNTEVGWIGGIYFGGYVVAVGALTALAGGPIFLWLLRRLAQRALGS